MSSIKSYELNDCVFMNCKAYFPSNKKIKKSNILVVDGVIKDLNYKGSSDKYKVINCEGKILCPSFLDLRAQYVDKFIESSIFL